MVLVAALATISLFIGVAELDAFILFASRVPRTVSLVLAGAAFAIIGLIMQLLVRNRFVEPGTTGATDAASLALLAVLLSVPGLPIAGKAIIAAVGALVGVVGFLALARRIPARSSVLVPIVGILYAGVIGAVTTFIAYRSDMLQELLSWGVGDFSSILRGRYEILYFAAAAALVAWIAADRFTVAGLGDDAARGLGLETRAVMGIGVTIIAVVTGILMVVTGAIPFLGLIAPNIVSRLIGDNMRRSVPLVALLGASMVLLCDIIGRVVRFPFELPISIVMGVLGGIVFLWMLLGTARPVDDVGTARRARRRTQRHATREAAIR
ncbi:ABC transporter permease [Microbacterium sp. C7(2022)]|uniref:ABC transporter permease n=1 Tax=Microbacterium sp. C7(2022) TaxID=2992759 RepID=UPI00237A4FAC|nr:iron chelate uptake ABC transporter family permease subunit [Microbacterium sp. C7(2022)]MDE0546206.1 iron chelate uptake ABC transporter family permease subunit [Microbacterium sp. C7(2022)]